MKNSMRVLAPLILLALLGGANTGCLVFRLCLNPDRSIQHPRFPELVAEMKAVQKTQGDNPRFLKLSLRTLERTRSILGKRSILAAYLENMVGLGYRRAGKNKLSIEHYLRALDIMESRLGSSHAQVAIIRSNLGQAYTSADEFEKANEQLREAQRIQRAVLPPSSPSHGIVLHHLGDNERFAGRYAKARAYYLEALKLEKYNRGPRHLNVAILLEKLGLTETELGRYKIAADYFRAEMKLIAAWPRDPGGRMAETLHGLSKTWFLRRDFARSAKLLRKAVRVLRRTAPARADRLRKYQSSLSATYREAGKYKDALRHGLLSLRLAEKIYRAPNERIMESRLTLGRLYLRMGRNKMALSELSRALASAKRVYRAKDRRLAAFYQELGEAQTGLLRFRAAEKTLARARNIARQSGDVRARLDALDALGDLAMARRLFPAAVKFRRQALELHKRTGGPDLARRYSNYAAASASAGNYREALRICRIAIKLAPDPDGLRVLRQIMGASLLWLGKKDQALVYLNQSLDYLRKKHGGDHASMRFVWKSLGQLYFDRGEYSKAMVFLEKSLKVMPTRGPPARDEITVRNLLALSLSKKGAFRRAERLLSDTIRLALKRYGDDSPNVALCYANMGLLLTHRSEYSRAKEFMNRALRIYDRVYAGKHADRAVLLSNLGLIADKQGDLKRAISLFNRAAKLNRSRFGDNHEKLAINYNNLGISYMRLNNKEKAEENFRRALKTAVAVHGEEHPMVALILNNAGRILEARKDNDGALAFYRRALAMNLRLLGSDHPAAARNYYSLARIMAGRGKFQAAEELCRKAIEIFGDSLVRGEHIYTLYDVAEMNRLLGRNKRAAEYLRTAVDRILRYRLELGRTRTGFTERYFRVFDRLIDTELALGNTERAFRANMRKQGLSLVEGVSERYALARGGVPARMRRKFLKLKAGVTAQADKLAVLEKEGKARKAYETLKALHASERRLSRMQTGMLTRYPRYAALRRPAAPKPKQLRARLKAGESIVSYSISGALPTAFVLGRNKKLRAVTLPTRAVDLNIKARNLHALCRTRIDSGEFRRILLKGGRELVWNTRLEKSRYRIRGGRVFEARGPGLKSQSNAAGELREVGRLGDFLTTNEAEELRDDLRRDLYRILIKPALDSRTRGLILIPDGSLHYVPFGILLDEKGREARDKQRLRVAPSANVWYNLRRSRASSARLSLFAVGDAIYDAAARDAVRGGGTRSAGKGRAIRALEQIRFANLPGTAGEVRAITRIAYGRPGEHALLGVRANRDLLLKYNRRGRLARYRILHFAVHGLFVEGNADLNALVLTLPRQARALKSEYARYRSENGDLAGAPYLRLGEVKTLRLDSRLVVLSACETSLGTEVSGEGMMGLPQAFLMAGSRSVIASLWAVDDKATSELMAELYRNMLKRGMHPERALRAAQATMRAKYPDPYYWAAFVYYGN